MSRSTESRNEALWAALNQLPGWKAQSGQWMACCPAHEDHNPSLSIKREHDGTLLIHCFAGCPTVEVVGRLGFGLRDLYPQREQEVRPIYKGLPFVTLYPYVDEQAVLLYQVLRYQRGKDKQFPVRSPNGQGGWFENMGDGPRVPYRLPELLAASPTEIVYLCEGEKDVDRLRATGLVATTNPGGAGNWRPEYSTYLQGRDVVLLRDNDPSGERHVTKASARLRGAARRAAILRLPGLDTQGADVSDWLDAGHTTSELEQLARAALEQPVEMPTAPNSTWLGSGLVCLADVVPEQIKWLWPGRIALGKLSILDGDPGLGKSVITLDIAARVSTGRCWPDGQYGALTEPAGVVLLSAEDGLADTIRPRLDAANADCQKIATLVRTVDRDGDRLPTLGDIAEIEEATVAMNARLVIIDPLMAYLPVDVSSVRDQDIRRALAPLAALADRTGVAMLVVRHLNKGNSSNALYRGGGSIGIIGAARTALIVARDPDDTTGERRIMAMAKSNLAALAPALAYRVEGGAGNPARVAWDGPTSHTASELLVCAEDQDGSPARGEAVDFLRDCLADGPQEAGVVKRLAHEAGIADRTLDRAKKTLGVAAYHEGYGKGSKWFWALGEPLPAIDRHDDQRTPTTNSGDLWQSLAIYEEAPGSLCPRCDTPCGADGLCPHCDGQRVEALLMAQEPARW